MQAQLLAGPGIKNASARTGRRIFRPSDDLQVVGDAGRGGRVGRGGKRY
ncbi:MAG: hypothetical protein QOF78_2705 [Phycisphaerales bacterium]|nr:hypothetical protein [Phycisphaerales bacterium]